MRLRPGTRIASSTGMDRHAHARRPHASSTASGKPSATQDQRPASALMSSTTVTWTRSWWTSSPRTGNGCASISATTSSSRLNSTRPACDPSSEQRRQVMSALATVASRYPAIAEMLRDEARH